MLNTFNKDFVIRFYTWTTRPNLDSKVSCSPYCFVKLFSNASFICYFVSCYLASLVWGNYNYTWAWRKEKVVAFPELFTPCRGRVQCSLNIPAKYNSRSIEYESQCQLLGHNSTESIMFSNFWSITSFHEPHHFPESPSIKCLHPPISRFQNSQNLRTFFSLSINRTYVNWNKN